MLKAQKYTIKLLEKRKINKEVFEFRFLKPKNLQFKPGQYLKIFLQIRNPDERGSSRYFTISSSPLSKFISITTKVVRSSFKKKLANLKKGDKVTIFAPLGYFDLDLQDPRPKVFLAGGIGVTPYHSILKTLEKKRLSFEIYLFASFSKASDIIYFDEFKNIELVNKKIKIVYTLTQDKKNNFEFGRITSQLIKKYLPNLSEAQFYVVGSDQMEKSFLEILEKENVKMENIFSENFPGY